MHSTRMCQQRRKPVVLLVKPIDTVHVNPIKVSANCPIGVLAQLTVDAVIACSVPGHQVDGLALMVKDIAVPINEQLIEHPLVNLRNAGSTARGKQRKVSAIAGFFPHRKRRHVVIAGADNAAGCFVVESHDVLAKLLN